jgi:hypothetical protein
MMHPPDVAMKKAQRNLIFGFIAITLVVNSIILLSGDVQSMNYFSDIMIPILAAVATGLAIIVVYRQKASGVFGRSYAALAAGLGLFLVAEILWSYYSIGLGIEAPFPSLADAFWLAAYAPFGYGLFTLSKLYSYGRHKKSNKAFNVMSIAVAVFAMYYVMQVVSVSDLTSTDGATAMIISVAYLILDMALIIPALLAVMSAGRGYLTSIPWIFVSWIFTAAADGLFGFTAVSSVAGEVPIWNVFFAAAYLSMGAGLLWHNKYMILDKNKVMSGPPSPG